MIAECESSENKASSQKKAVSLVESFFSIQGEGKYSGAPSLFARFGGCNLSCEGFGCEFISPLDGSKLIGCDSLFAVNRKHFGAQWEDYDDPELLFERITKPIFNLDFSPHIVITGGEPLIHYKNRVFYDFVKRAVSGGFKVFIETNAAINIDFEMFEAYKEVGFSMSVKLSNSKEDYDRRVNKKAIRSIAENSKEAFFKFVLDAKMIKNGSAKEEIDDIARDMNLPVFCMPLGKNRDEMRQNCEEVVRFCLKNGYNYTDRIHIRLWGDRRGV